MWFVDLEDDPVDAAIVPEIFLVEVGVALVLEHARLVLVPATIASSRKEHFFKAIMLKTKRWKKKLPRN
jgi:hypothetical protein